MFIRRPGGIWDAPFDGAGQGGEDEEEDRRREEGLQAVQQRGGRERNVVAVARVAVEEVV